MRLDLVQTVALAGLLLFAGYGLRKLIPVLARYNIPAPVAGGLPASVLAVLFVTRGLQPLQFDTTLQVVAHHGGAELLAVTLHRKGVGGHLLRTRQARRAAGSVHIK